MASPMDIGCAVLAVGFPVIVLVVAESLGWPLWIALAVAVVGDLVVVLVLYGLLFLLARWLDGRRRQKEGEL